MLNYFIGVASGVAGTGLAWYCWPQEKVTLEADIKTVVDQVKADVAKVKSKLP